MKMANVMRGLAVATLFASLWPIACGSDSGDNSGNKDSQKGTGGGKSSGDSGTPTTTPTSTASSAIPMGSVGCGTKVCAMRADLMGAPCCADPFKGTCGYVSALGGRCTAAPPPPPADCPTVPPLGGVLQLRSCCTSMGECGIDAGMFGGGSCINYADAKAMAMMYMSMGGGAAGGPGSMFGNFTPMFPDEKSCVPQDAGAP
jgi:hypothetical protein